jgi:hypothetical protein
MGVPLLIFVPGSQTAGSNMQTCPFATPEGGFSIFPAELTFTNATAPVHDAAASAPLRKVSTTGARETAPRTSRRRPFSFAAISVWSVPTGLDWSFMLFHL